MNLSAQDHQTFFTCEGDAGRTTIFALFWAHFFHFKNICSCCGCKDNQVDSGWPGWHKLLSFQRFLAMYVRAILDCFKIHMCWATFWAIFFNGHLAFFLHKHQVARIWLSKLVVLLEVMISQCINH
jgi:hypothetical protein